MTTDNLLTLNIDGKVSYEARTIKPKNELLDKRLLKSLKLKDYIGIREE